MTPHEHSVPFVLPTDGYVTLPDGDLGTDATRALALAGVSAVAPRIAYGYAVLRDGRIHGRFQTMEEARLEAAGSHEHSAATILEAMFIGRGDTPVFQRREVVQWADPMEVDASWVDTESGMLVTKAANPQNPYDSAVMSGRLASTLRYHDRRVVGPQLKRYLDSMDRDWSKLTPAQIDSTLVKSKRLLDRIPARKLTEPWRKAMVLTLSRVGRGTRALLKHRHFPDLRTSLELPETEAVQTLARQRGAFFRDEMGVRSAALTARGTRIIQNGLREGLGRDQIARDLRDNLRGMYNGRSANYARTVASAAVNRARSIVEVKAYASAGVHSLEIQAIVDLRTTEICRCLDGQIISVSACSDLQQEALDIKSPEDIYQASPFCKMQTDPRTGVRSVFTTSGVRIADQVRSGMGRLDDTGQWKRFLTGNQLPENANLGPPPYHHLCRSYTVPRNDVFQVPQNYSMIARGAPPTAAPALPPRPRLRGPAGTNPLLWARRHRERAARPAKQVAQRPVQMVREPRPNMPVVSGQPLPIDQIAIQEEWLFANVSDDVVRNLRSGKNNVTFQAWRQNETKKWVTETKDWSTLRKSVKSLEDAVDKGWWEFPGGSTYEGFISTRVRQLTVRDLGRLAAEELDQAARYIGVTPARIEWGKSRVIQILDERGWKFHTLRVEVSSAHLGKNPHAAARLKNLLTDPTIPNAEDLIRKELARLHKEGSINFADLKAVNKLPDKPRALGQLKERRVQAANSRKATKVAPRADDPYREDGLLMPHVDDLEEQIRVRARDMDRRLNSFLEAEGKRLGFVGAEGQMLYKPLEVGKSIQRFVKTEWGTPTLRVTRKMLPDQNHLWANNVARKEVQDLLLNNGTARGLKFGEALARAEKLAGTAEFEVLIGVEERDMWAKVLSRLSPRMREALLAEGLPTVVQMTKALPELELQGAHWITTSSTIPGRHGMLLVNTTREIELERVLFHEMGHVLDTAGTKAVAGTTMTNAGNASVAYRNLRTAGGTLVKDPKMGTIMEGGWVDRYEGKVYDDEFWRVNQKAFTEPMKPGHGAAAGGSREHSEILSRGFERHADEQFGSLGHAYLVDPMSVDFTLSQMEGQFVLTKPPF